jgi:hypothetical protein
MWMVATTFVGLWGQRLKHLLLLLSFLSLIQVACDSRHHTHIVVGASMRPQRA